MPAATLSSRIGNAVRSVASAVGLASKPTPANRPAELHEFTGARPIHARYDAAQTTDTHKNLWAGADNLDADSAHSRGVRQKLVSRSRYEAGNNGYLDGMVQTDANYLVGVGPQLRLQTQSPGFNALVESQWKRWAKAAMFRRKLWTMAHAKTQDGEGLGVVRYNPGLAHPVKLDVVLFETEQCQTPYLQWGVEGYVDGIRFDEFGNPLWYDILRYHPGGPWVGLSPEAEQVPAKFVLHWFKMRRPGQHRGVPEFSSTLNCGGSSRRWREATIAAAEAIANFSVLLKTQMTPDTMTQPVAAMSTMEMQHAMMTALPMGWDAFQPRAEQPASTYAEFNRAQIAEQGRPKSMPYNVAAADSSSYNYASGRLDHQTYFSSLDVERADCNDMVLDPLFSLWFQDAALEFGWVNGPGEVPPHTWDWPKHPVADINSEAKATEMNLRTGATTLADVWARAGEDFEDKITEMAGNFGVSEADMRKALFMATFPTGFQPGSPATPRNDEEENEDV